MFLFTQEANAQFYNGHQMDFGKNRVQYSDFYWSFLKYDKYDIYFYEDGEDIAKFTGDYVNDEIQKLEQRLNHKLNKRLIFTVYNKFSDFKQSNIGLVTGKEEFNTGGITKIKNNKVSLFFQGNHLEYEKQVRESIAEVIIMEMLYGTKFSENLSASSMLNIPDWFLKGLSSYLSDDWNIDIENRVKDGIQANSYKKFNHITGDDAIYAGHSFWKYLNDYYGNTVITDIIYLTRIHKNVNRALYQVLGIHFKDLTLQWFNYYSNYYANDIFRTDSLQTNHSIIKKPKRTRVYYHAKISPCGNYIAYVSNELGQYKIWIYDSESEKTKVIKKEGYSIRQINDYTYPIIEWHPSGKYLTLISEKNGGLKLTQYSLGDKNFIERNLLYFDKILDFSYSSDASKMVFSAVKKGNTDIFVYDIASSSSEQITSDIADDFNPSFVQNDTKILFSSNRLNDTLNPKYTPNTYSNHFDFYIYNYKSKDDLLTNLTNTPYSNEISAFEIGSNQYTYLNDKNGIRNLYIGNYDSTISFIDTAIHYQYFLNEKALTNKSRNILEHHINGEKTKQLQLSYSNKLYNIDIKENFLSEKLSDQNLPQTTYQKILNKDFENEEKKSLINNKTSTFDSIYIFSDEENYVDINNYIFEIEKPYFPFKYQNIPIDTTNLKSQTSKIQIYQRTFFIDHFVSQVDFSFLNSSYQAFTGGAVYFNPGLNALLKIGAFDLLEDYKIIAGVRFSADFNSNEYLVSLENLKKKVDEQIVFHRQNFENPTDTFITKTLTHKLMYVRNMPFNQVSGIKGTITARHDKLTYLSTDRISLQKKDNHKIWAGLKLEYIFDNTISTGVNLYNGTRYKIFAEYYNQVNKSETDLYVVGVDFRHYQKIHRDLIFASRFAASTSFGKNKLIYYLGGVDNWTNFSANTPSFIPLSEIPIDENETYAFQSVATNMRGFPQNIRNGNSFALINTELRWPIVKYFSGYPVNSAFWSNMQLIGFFDVGTAWSGLTPYSEENAYDKKVVHNKPITIIIDTEKEPIVAGYGFGARIMVFGYFMRFDWAWGIENAEIMPRIFYFSLNLDF
ncbi:MAG: hypothetical protein A2X13_14110 [Bacteroidetes bacterium GWC2_33_15]|nr:MAG: hypothetical protein A2X10_09325 [Bacteroidetes bacterium GWA2_33_15]OFX50475.1 MAG: hypothetical protein A2X13_14110 [Bacteroidetes bacterium GWC2_33_15]OFX66607.1 MAG: hypothetical protein A2X15_07765 [Bacteroidetes bacterium GWB2_32_14]OFX69225.1 MAG: hypothetical protein A2X14_08695 [Bacteroidetes bacterium GWD2_33_33]HAN18536.1 hypothetical protein [Bacteroidales bacterium]